MSSKRSVSFDLSCKSREEHLNLSINRIHSFRQGIMKKKSILSPPPPYRSPENSRSPSPNEEHFKQPEIPAYRSRKNSRSHSLNEEHVNLPKNQRSRSSSPNEEHYRKPPKIPPKPKLRVNSLPQLINYAQTSSPQISPFKDADEPVFPTTTFSQKCAVSRSPPPPLETSLDDLKLPDNNKHENNRTEELDNYTEDSKEASTEGDNFSSVSGTRAWQDGLSSSSAALSFLLSTGTLSDITFAVGPEGRKFKVLRTDQ